MEEQKPKPSRNKAATPPVGAINPATAALAERLLMTLLTQADANTILAGKLSGMVDVAEKCLEAAKVIHGGKGTKGSVSNVT